MPNIDHAAIAARLAAADAGNTAEKGEALEAVVAETFCQLEGVGVIKRNVLDNAGSLEIDMRKLGSEVTGRKAIARLDAAQNFQAGNGSRHLGAGNPVHNRLAVDAILRSNDRLVQMPRSVAMSFHMQRQRFMEYVSVAPDGRVRLGKLDDSPRLWAAFLI